MMGRLNRDQGQLFYCFNLEAVVPEDHLVRALASVLDLSWVHGELVGRPSIDPILMIRTLDPNRTCCRVLSDRRRWLNSSLPLDRSASPLRLLPDLILVNRGLHSGA